MALICFERLENIDKIWDFRNVCILEINNPNIKRWYFCYIKKHFITNRLRKVEKNLGDNEFNKSEEQNDWVLIKVNDNIIKRHRNIIVAFVTLKKECKKCKQKKSKFLVTINSTFK